MPGQKSTKRLSESGESRSESQGGWGGVHPPCPTWEVGLIANEVSHLLLCCGGEAVSAALQSAEEAEVEDATSRTVLERRNAVVSTSPLSAEEVEIYAANPEKTR